MFFTVILYIKFGDFQVSSLFITATGTNIGKTRTTLKLIETLAAQGYSVGVYKPIETGVTDIPADAAVLLEACRKVNNAFKELTPADITAYTFELPAAPFCADENKRITPEMLIEKHQALSGLCDILLIEGAGGLMVPITKEYLMLHFIKELDCPALLVTPSRLGCINDTLLSMMALRSFDIGFDWCVNLYEDKEDFAKVTQPYYDAVFPEWWSVEEGLEDFAASFTVNPI